MFDYCLKIVNYTVSYAQYKQKCVILHRILLKYL